MKTISHKDIFLSLYTHVDIYIYIYIYIYSLRKSNNYSLKSAQHKSVVIFVGRRRCKTTLLGT